MIKIDVRSDIKDVVRVLDDLARKQVPFATSLAINKTAQLVREAEKNEIVRVFDNPTPWTRNSVFMKPGTKAKPEAVVWLKDETAVSTGTPASKYLVPQIEGGGRHLKGFEALLQRRLVMPKGWKAVPGAKAKVDAFGNMSRGEIVKILSYLGAFDQKGQGFTTNATDKTKEKLRKGTRTRMGTSYFAAMPGRGDSVTFAGTQGYSSWKRGRVQNLTPGIYRKTFTAFGAAIEPIIIFVKATHYRKRYDFHGVAARVVAAELPRQFDAALKRALETAR